MSGRDAGSKGTDSYGINQLAAAEWCACKPWEVRWRPDNPGWCSGCDRPFNDGRNKARAVCVKTEGCLLLPDHEGDCL